MIISGLMKLTLLDFPGHTACTVFTAGCNFRCPFCHNASLVRGESLDIPEDEFFSFLEKRVGRLDGVAITGGEPLMHPEIDDFVRKIKEKGFKVKLDTNGSYPQRLKEMVNAGLCDYVAMDIKSSETGYNRACGTIVPFNNVKESIDFLLAGNVDYEFRTTVAKPVLVQENFADIGRLIKGAKRYFLQGFVDSGDILSEGMSAYTKEEMETFKNIVQQYVPNVSLRGMD